jgi:serine/threonine protein phosphatase 1
MRVGEASLPAGRRIYAIGDIHGRLDCLESMLHLIDADLAENPVEDPMLVFLGDYGDRGPDSRGVIDLLARKSRKDNVICLKGNHDECFERFLRNPNEVAEAFLSWGGVETLASYAVPATGAMDNNRKLSLEMVKSVPDRHRNFLSELKDCYFEGDYFFCHAGIRPDVAIDAQQSHDLIWIREEFLSHEGPFEKVVVHGHTPVPQVEILPNRINTDTRAYETGVLSCVVLEGSSIRILQTEN